MNRAANLIGLNRIDVQDVIPSGSGGMGMFGHISMGFPKDFCFVASAVRIVAALSA